MSVRAYVRVFVCVCISECRVCACVRACVCVCACLRACVFACVRLCVCISVSVVSVRACVCVCQFKDTRLCSRFYLFQYFSFFTHRNFFTWLFFSSKALSPKSLDCIRPSGHPTDLWNECWRYLIFLGKDQHMALI